MVTTIRGWLVVLGGCWRSFSTPQRSMRKRIPFIDAKIYETQINILHSSRATAQARMMVFHIDKYVIFLVLHITKY